LLVESAWLSTSNADGGQTTPQPISSDSTSTVNAIPYEKPEVDGNPSLIVRVSSLGVWQSTRDSQQKAARKVEVLAILEPRLPGRGLVSEDHAAAEDLADNPGDFDRIQTYALASRGQNGKTSLNFDLGSRIEGNIWLEQRVRFFEDPAWDKRIRELVLQEIGSRFIAFDRDRRIYLHPHPFGGSVTFRDSVDGNTRSDLERLRVPTERVKKSWNWPSNDLAKWQRYQLYQGGFEHNAQPVGSSLERVTLRPGPENPLGVFVARGTVNIRNDVTIQGTLVCEGTVNITGHRVRMTSYNWRDSHGEAILPDAALMPRLPAIVAEHVTFSRETTTLVEGAVVVTKSITGAGGTHELASGPYGLVGQNDLLGKATARPLGQPFSIVTLSEGPALTAISGGESYAVWLDKNGSGSWYPVLSVRADARTLTVVGEVQAETPTMCRIRRCRKRSVDIRGPVVADWCDINRPDDWGSLSHSQWEFLHAAWLATGELAKDRKSRLAPTIAFLDFLANPKNFAAGLFSQNHSRYGLTLEPTFHVRPQPGIRYRWSPPLFEPYTGTADNGKHAGYRWKVLSWREIEGHSENPSLTVVESPTIKTFEATSLNTTED
jgi:hypothetical protein